MSPASIATIFWIAMIAIQIGVTQRFLEQLKKDNRAEFDRIAGGKEQLWNALNPLRVGVAYASPELHELWGLSAPTRRTGRVLRVVTVVSSVALLGFVAAMCYEWLWLYG